MHGNVGTDEHVFTIMRVMLMLITIMVIDEANDEQVII